jgi:YD repeat-containing protein
VAVRRQKSLVLILAREFASQLSMPMFIADADGRLVFYNEPAEEILGMTYAEAGELSAEEWAATFTTQTLAGEPLELDRLPAGIALLERRPVHGTHRLLGLDGTWRTVSVTALPLLTGAAEPAGMVAIFWEQTEG